MEEANKKIEEKCEAVINEDQDDDAELDDSCFVMKSITHEMVTPEESVMIGQLFEKFYHGRSASEVFVDNKLVDEEKFDEYAKDEIAKIIAARNK